MSIVRIIFGLRVSEDEIFDIALISNEHVIT